MDPVLKKMFKSGNPVLSEGRGTRVILFALMLLVLLAATELDWQAVENGFHIVASQDFDAEAWLASHQNRFRYANWGLFLPICFMAAGLTFRLSGGSKRDTTVLMGLLAVTHMSGLGELWASQLPKEMLANWRWQSPLVYVLRWRVDELKAAFYPGEISLQKQVNPQVLQILTYPGSRIYRWYPIENHLIKFSHSGTRKYQIYLTYL